MKQQPGDTRRGTGTAMTYESIRQDIRERRAAQRAATPATTAVWPWEPIILPALESTNSDPRA